MSDCKHPNMKFDHTFAVNPANGERMYQFVGWCSSCGAPIQFAPKPSLSIDCKTFQIPFQLGAPDPVRLFPKLGPAEPIRIGGPKQDMN